MMTKTTKMPQTTQKPPTPLTPYESLGGSAGVQALVHRFYALMDELPEAYSVRQLHPESLDSSQQNLFDFLSGWFGGPSLYIEKNGHPRLRMRHNPYVIGLAQRNEWMLCMAQALTEQVADLALRARLIDTFSQMADHLINTQGGATCSAAVTEMHASN